MIGQTLGHYRIESKLGEGGMGVVYKAHDTRLNRAVAIKVLSAEAVANPVRKRRFVQEARAASALNHPNIIHIYDVDQASGVDFIAMELVQGKTLDQLIGDQGLPVAETLKYAIQIADALSAAHAAGIIHRDIKPGNIMVTGSVSGHPGFVKVLDFGLAKLTEPDQSVGLSSTQTAPPSTEKGAIVGTFAYMSPEQGQEKNVDARSDIFSFGSLLYELLTGRRAFRGDNRLAVLSAIVSDEPQRVSHLIPAIPMELEKLISRALRKDPERRWQSMADVRVALTEIKEESESGSRLSGLQALVRARARRPQAWMIATLAALFLCLGAIWIHYLKSKGEAEFGIIKTLPLTSFPGRELDAVLAPNGDQVAFAWSGAKDDNFDIYVQLIGAGTPLRLTNDPANDFSPVWSPDGRHIAFCRESTNRNEVYMVPSLGGSERRLGDSAQTWFGRSWLDSPTRATLTWSADGKFLVVVDQNSPQEPESLFILSIETGQKTRLTSPPAGYLGDQLPAISPDGKHLAFVRFRAIPSSDIYVLALTSDAIVKGEPRRVTFDERVIWGLTWTPDSGSIVFSSDRAGSRGLWRVPAGSPVSRPQPTATGSENAFSPSISSKHRLVYTQFVADRNIWQIDARTLALSSSRYKDGWRRKLISSTLEEAAPQFSPNGDGIAFVSSRSGNPEIWVCDNEGLNPVQLTFNGPATGSPRWSPDGQHIAFDGANKGPRHIYVVNARGGAPRRLTLESSQEVRPSWSRDGRWIYFGSDRSGSWQVWKVPREGGPAVQVTRKGGREAFESFDGKFVYYHKRDIPGIWRVPADGGEETKVLDQVVQGHWAILERGIYLLNPAAMPSPTIEFFSLGARRLTQIAELPREGISPGGFAGPSFAVSPDARWILYVQQDHVQSDIVLVENFR